MQNGADMNTILATTDFSLENRSMLQYAAQLAMDLNYRLRLIHATHIPISGDEFFSSETTLSSLSASDHGQMLQEVVRLRNKFGPSLTVDAEVRIGYVYELVQQELQQGDISLVVMSVSKSNRLERFLFGSAVSEHIGNLPCPLLLVPKNYTYRKWKSVAVAYDRHHLEEGQDLDVLHKALAYADGKVHAVHVKTSTGEKVTTEEAENLAQWLNEPIMKVHEVEDREKSVSEALLDWTHRYRPNTMMMIARKHGLLHQLMEESTSRNVAFQTNTPLLICTEAAHGVHSQHSVHQRRALSI